MNIQNILIKPLVTEKSLADASLRKYTFAVPRSASKTDVKKAVKAVFNVVPIAVETRVVKGKTKRIGMRRTEKADSVWKKATVTLKQGDKISLFGTDEEKKKKK